MRRITLIVVGILLLAMAVMAQAQTISVTGDEVLEGVLDSSGEAQYILSAEAGQVIRITLESESFDAYLRLRNADGEILAEDDDSAGSLNALIGPYRIPENGDYTIVVTSLSQREEGEFTLTVDSIVIETLVYGDSVEGELVDNRYTDQYMFNGEEGDVIAIQLESDDFDAFLLLEAGGMELISNDDIGFSRNSFIGPYILPETGSYIISVTSYFKDSEGAYRLTLDAVDTVTLKTGETLDTTLNGAEILYFAYDGRYGELIDITVDTGSVLDTYLKVVSPYSYEVAFNDDTHGVDPAVRNVQLTDDGMHYIAVLPMAAMDGETPLSITLSDTELYSLNDGPFDFVVTDTEYEAFIAFDGEADSIVQLTVDVETEASAYLVLSIVQAGEEIGYITYEQVVGQQSFNIYVPEDGPVLIHLSDYYGDSRYTVSLKD